MFVIVQMQKVKLTNFKSFVSLICLFWCRLPYEWKHFPYGYLSAFAIEAVFSTYFFVVVSSIANFLLGIFMFLAAFVDDMKQSLNTIDQNWKTNRNTVELIKDFGENIQFHADAKQLSHQYSLKYNRCVCVMFHCK